jgi:hypothetical protein
MVKIPKIDKVLFLVNRKFNKFRTRNYGRNALSGYIDPDYANFEINLKTGLSAAKLGEAENYRAKLRMLGNSELEALYQQEIYKKYLEDDQTRLFHSKVVEADFDYWSKMPHWTLDEAIALSFGKDPEQVNWNSLNSTSAYLSPFVENYKKLRVLTSRAVTSGKLFDPVLPSIFLNWLLLNEINFPNVLGELVDRRSGGVEDWKKLYLETLSKRKSDLELVVGLQNKLKQTHPDTPNRASGTIISDDYIPPYIEFLLGAIPSLNLSANNRVNKDEVVNWLAENWPDGLEGKSDRLINSMATLLRRPEDKKGGNTSWG